VLALFHWSHSTFLGLSSIYKLHDTYLVQLDEKKCLKITSYGRKKDATRIDIREYYEKDGEKLPGKKGISLPLEVFTVMVGYLPQIEIELKKRGEMLSRPDYGKAEPTGLEQQVDGAADVEGDDDDDQDGEGDGNASKSKNGGKKNFEETSDEEE
jgi:hypothetical protein